VLYVPGRHFYFQNPQPNTLRLGFASVDEAKIMRGAETMGEILRTELRKRRRGARAEWQSRVALV
jgi:DNA-binding transcriptional MocR family regulator